ncbi:MULTISPECIES: DUF3977 family protein [Lactococcus]|jgi:hypothetical protein|uniref:DUF3977 family protein n=1 Tax=Lactococcus TaxID=1357 RepID=UPI0003448FCE|nr:MULTISPECIES: DUF3977 family protein [Lactococcus]KZK37803.1 hypothetical protein P7266_1204 [Lactococcus cremoris]MCA2381370.1 DUF3977 family protein [Lactococcus sp. SK2-659]MCI2095687.1 DUF3977 family protein [Lactococcus lactis]MCI2140157.1 DUF3977 family protein [Lactococcus lactis]MCI2190270.1 DUF3977 family protein [Lactococcus lactis]
MTEKIFVEVGFDLDNNRFGFGRSVEIEYGDGTEKRFKFTDKSVSKYFNPNSFYLRIWVGKRIFIIDTKSPHFRIKNKKRTNFKFVLGKWGEKND